MTGEAIKRSAQIDALGVASPFPLFCASAKRVATLERENALLRLQLQNAQPAGFVESDGLLWKRTAEGFDRRPYCPIDGLADDIIVG